MINPFALDGVGPGTAGVRRFAPVAALSCRSVWIFFLNLLENPQFPIFLLIYGMQITINAFLSLIF